MSQPRSRPMLMLCDAKIDGDDFNVSSRGSPTTPLSWSGGGGGAASLSAADGFEDTCSSHIRGSPPAAPSRSKRTTADETTSTSTKISRKKKTFAQLKEESLLLEERVYLRKVCLSLEGCSSFICSHALLSSVFITVPTHSTGDSIDPCYL
ncbi:uncharacterized protein LOC120149843 [Hibiscus syriacus]|uniref:uncharacterized protein LOC120149843 n=1 Tax=Hibiscus syriacus TaxID=106335 RepID=UPI00192132DC|nr:uncharacterized protein LOC120149843 [Hibiscus syriacus]